MDAASVHRQILSGIELSDGCDCATCKAAQILVDTASVEAKSDIEARSFDLKRVVAPVLGGMPEEGWPLSALLVAARQAILSPPWIEPLKRATIATSALALAAEQGIPADAYVRGYLSRAICRRVLWQAADAFRDSTETGRSWDEYPKAVSRWFRILQDLNLEPLRFADLFTAATSSPIPALLGEWVSSAAMAHIVDWRAVGYLHVKADLRDLVLPGGTEGTTWVLDRLTLTSTADWSRGSAEWEVAYANDPEGVARFVGLPHRVLHERPTSVSFAADALTRRITCQVEGEEAARGLHLSDMHEQIIGSLRRGDLAEAEAEARRSVALAPQSFYTQNALAFVVAVSQPEFSLDLLDTLRPSRTVQECLVKANQATALLAGRKTDAAAEMVETLPEIPTEAYLWDSAALLGGSALLVYTSFSEWKIATLSALRERSDATPS